MNISYLIYAAERPRTAAEQREADAQAGELAAATARLGRLTRHPVTARRDAGHRGRRLARATALHSIPRPR